MQGGAQQNLFSFAGTERKLTIAKIDTAWLPSRTRKMCFQAKESMKTYQIFLNSIKLSQTALMPHVIFISTKN